MLSAPPKYVAIRNYLASHEDAQSAQSVLSNTISKFTDGVNKDQDLHLLRINTAADKCRRISTVGHGGLSIFNKVITIGGGSSREMTPMSREQVFSSG
jgi:hypothetical protein